MGLDRKPVGELVGLGVLAVEDEAPPSTRAAAVAQGEQEASCGGGGRSGTPNLLIMFELRDGHLTRRPPPTLHPPPPRCNFQLNTYRGGKEGRKIGDLTILCHSKAEIKPIHRTTSRDNQTRISESCLDNSSKCRRMHRYPRPAARAKVSEELVGGPHCSF